MRKYVGNDYKDIYCNILIGIDNNKNKINESNLLSIKFNGYISNILNNAPVSIREHISKILLYMTRILVPDRQKNTISRKKTKME